MQNGGFHGTAVPLHICLSFAKDIEHTTKPRQGIVAADTCTSTCDISVTVMETGSHCGDCEEFCLLGYEYNEVNRRFGGPSRLHLQGQRISHAINQHAAGSKQSRLYDISQRTELLITETITQQEDS